MRMPCSRSLVKAEHIRSSLRLKLREFQVQNPRPSSQADRWSANVVTSSSACLLVGFSFSFPFSNIGHQIYVGRSPSNLTSS